MAKLAKIFGGLTGVFAALVCVSVTLGVVMEKYPSSLDAYFNTLSSKVETEHTDEADWVFESEYKSAKEAYEGQKAFAIEAADESLALLKNATEEDGTKALPLAKDAKITLLGLRSYAPNYGDSGSGSLPDTKAAEDNLIYDAFANAGFQINPDMLEAYANYCDTLSWAKAAQGPMGFTSPNYNEITVTNDIPELSLSELATWNANYANSNKDYDTAIVVVGRPGGESDSYWPGEEGLSGMTDKNNAPDSGNIMGLSQEEKEIIKYANDNFSKTIVLINNTQQMEIDDLVDGDLAVDAIMWIGYPGSYGFNSVARVLNGTVNPSARLGDTYAVNTAVNPAMMNFGDETAWATSVQQELTNVNTYLIEAEGIYTGYRYYETRYYDSIVNPSTSNAKNAAAGQWVDSDGLAGTTSTDSWNYEDEVSYSFGYGLSYTTFTQEIIGEKFYGDLKTNAEITVKVTNTGDVAGKDVVELYVQTPYTSYDKTNKVEKSAIQLIDYEKTDLLEKGESQEITLYVDLANLASYDYTNAKTYVLDNGDYYFALGNGAHDALNNVLAAQGYTTANGMTANGDAEKVYTWKELEGDEASPDTRTFSVSDNGTEITNQLTTGIYAMDIVNGFDTNLDSTIKYLSRSDWLNTYPDTYYNLDATSDQNLYKQLSNDFIDIKTTDNTSDYVWGSTDTNYTLSQMKLADWDDDRWDDIVDQVTIDEFLDFAANAFHNIQAIDSVGYAGNNADDGPNGSDSHLLSEGSYKGEAFTDTETVNPDSPNGYTYGEYGTRVPPSSTNFAYTWNKELCYRDGEVILGESTLMLELPIMIGPACNLHRTAYNGRGAEYYSEDPILSGYTCSATVQGAQSKGCLVNVKHFAFNDQEINRGGVAVFETEQKARELELRNFQQAIEAKGKPSSFIEAEGEDATTYVQGALGVMTSYNRIGATTSSANYGAAMNILRNEWGFNGYNVTDFSGVTLKASPKESILAGTTAFCGVGSPDVSYWSANDLKNDADMCAAIKANIKSNLWALANSAAINGTNDTTHRVWLMSTWRKIYIAAEAVTGTLLGLSAVAFVVTEVLDATKKKKEG